MSSHLVIPLLIKHLGDQKAVTDKIGRTPLRIFPGDVPLRVDGVEIKPPWVNFERSAWSEETTFTGGTGSYTCPTRVVVIAPTITQAGEIYQVIRDQLHAKWSQTWSTRLWIGESQMDLGNQVPLLEADGSPSSWQQIVGELFLLCSILPVSE